MCIRVKSVLTLIMLVSLGCHQDSQDDTTVSDARSPKEHAASPGTAPILTPHVQTAHSGNETTPHEKTKRQRHAPKTTSTGIYNAYELDLLYRVVWTASIHWRNAFNSGDVSACGDYYEEEAVFRAHPFGLYVGKEAICKFVQQLIDDGYQNVRYIDPHMIALDTRSVLISANWTMNKAQGYVYREVWVLQRNGKAKLREVDLEAAISE